MSTDAQLVALENINAIELFKGPGLDDLLARIKQEVGTLVPDVDTSAGRKEIASLAYKVARSKTAIDDAGKTLVAGWKQQVAEVDATRKRARDFLDALKAEVRAPLDAWEAEQERVEREAVEAEAKARADAEAARTAEIERKERELREREEAVAKAEAERARIEHEARIKQEATEAAQRDAAAIVARAQAEVVRQAEAARQAAEQAERDKADAVRRAEEHARHEAEAKERAVAEQAARDKAEEERRITDREHLREVNNEVLKALMDAGVERCVALKVVTLIASGRIVHTTINY